MSQKSILTPTGWGGNSTYFFGSAGGTFPQPYSNNPDLAGGAGFGTGNSFKAVSIACIINVNDVSGFKNFSGSFLVSRYLGKGSSISVGGLHLFANPIKSDAGSSYYFVFSHTVQSLPSNFSQASRLSYSVGVGTGRFLNKSDKDKRSGKGNKGTAFFSNLSYELFENFNVNAEWTGLNFGVGTSWRPSYKLPAITIGITDITRFSGNKVRFVCAVGYAFLL